MRREYGRSLNDRTSGKPLVDSVWTQFTSICNVGLRSFRSDHLELYSSKIRSDHCLLRTNSVRSDQCLAETNSFRSNDLELYSFRSDHCLVGTNRAEKAYIEALSLNTPGNTLISNLHQQHLLWQHRLYFCYIHCIGDFTVAGHNIIDLLSSEHLLVREL